MLQCLSSKHQFYSFVQTFLRFQMLSYLSSCTQQVNIKKKAGDGGGKEEEGRRGGEKPLYYTVHTIFSISKKTNNPNKNILNKKPNAQKIKKQNITNAAKFACRKKAHQHHLSLHTHVDFRVGRCISQLPDRTQMAQSGALEEILVKTLSYLQRCGWTKRSQKNTDEVPQDQQRWEDITSSGPKEARTYPPQRSFVVLVEGCLQEHNCQECCHCQLSNPQSRNQTLLLPSL